MLIEHLETELQQIHKGFKILKNQKAKELATVFFYGEPLFAVPANQIYEEPMPSYGIELPSGSFVRHRTRSEAIAYAKGILDKMKSDPDYEASLMGTGIYSKENLK